MRGRWFFLLTGLLPVMLAGGTGRAEERVTPPNSYFTGVYERVGRDGAKEPGLINDLVRLSSGSGAGVEPGSDADYGPILLHSCDPVAREGEPVVLNRSVFDEVPNILESEGGPFRFWCQFFYDHSNYPVLTCASETGARFTLWVVTDERAASCGG